MWHRGNKCSRARNRCWAHRCYTSSWISREFCQVKVCNDPAFYTYLTVQSVFSKDKCWCSFWQQAGRSGRRLQPSLSIYVAFDSPIDQYFMKLPKKLFENPIEHCHVDASNSQVCFPRSFVTLIQKKLVVIRVIDVSGVCQVIEQHISCAAFEHPLCVKFDEKYFGNCLQNSILTLQRKGYLMYDSSCDIWSYMGPQVHYHVAKKTLSESLTYLFHSILRISPH